MYDAFFGKNTSLKLFWKNKNYPDTQIASTNCVVKHSYCCSSKGSVAVILSWNYNIKIIKQLTSNT